MYNVSAAYKTAMKSNVHVYRLRGTIGDVPFTEENLLYGSLRISNQCSEGDEIKLGSVYTGELRTTFVGLNIPRKSWRGKVITLREEMLVASDTWEAVPLGVFIVGDSTHSLKGTEVVAYDAMQNLDKTIQLDTSLGTLYDFAAYACEICGVTLENEDFEDFPNGSSDITFNIYPDNDMETWRDLIYWVAQAMGCIATINRSGNLEFRQYSTTEIDTISEYDRLADCKFSDFEVKYTGMSVVNIAEEATKYVYVDPDDGLTYNMGQNPLLQDLIESRTQSIIDEFSTIELTPFTAEVMAGAAYDLCDCILFSGGIADGARCGIMSYEYRYGDSLRMEGFGKNPDLANARSKTDKDISGLMARSADEIIYYDFMNTKDIHIADGQTVNVIVIRYVTLKDTHIDFHAEIKHTNSADLKVKVNYMINGALYYYEPEQVELEGVNLLHLLLVLHVDANTLGTLIVKITADGGDIDILASDANAYLAGYGMGAGEIPWDGTIEIEEEWTENIAIPSITFDKTSVLDSVIVAVQVPMAINLTDEAYEVAIPSMSVVSMIDSVAFDAVLTQTTIDTDSQTTYDSTKVTTQNGKWELIAGTTDPQTIYSSAIDLTHPDITGIESITATYEGSPVFAVSVDNLTWKIWDAINAQWVTISSDTTGMAPAVMADIATSDWSTLIVGTSEIYIRWTLSAETDTVIDVIVDYTN